MDKADPFLRAMLEDVWSARQSSTVQKYCYSLRKYFSFSLLFNAEIVLPADSLSVAKYLAYMRHIGSAHSAFKLIIVALKWLHSFIPGINKFNCPLEDQFILKLRDSAARNVPKKVNQKEPIRGDIVKLMIGRLSDDASLIQIRNVLMPAMAYSLLLRHDELCHLNCKFIVRVGKGLKIIIPSSKTDVFREGKTVFLAKQYDGPSVSNLFDKYIQVSGLSLGDNHFLFAPIYNDKLVNEKLSYSTYLGIVKAQIANLGLNPAFFGTHSLRSGGATDLASKVTEFELLLSGRWRDPRSLKSYVKVSEDRRFAISNKLSLV
jgi:integrase